MAAELAAFADLDAAAEAKFRAALAEEMGRLFRLPAASRADA